MGIKFSEEEVIIMEDKIRNLTSKLINCDSKCNGCVLKKVIDVYDSYGVRMDKCDLLMLIEDNL